MRAYLEIFTFGDLYGLDLGVEEYKSHQTQKLDDQFTRAHMFVGDQTDVFLLYRIGKEAISRNGGFDVINDDGGHHMKHQSVSLLHLWKYVKPGGYYIIEDTETSYYESYGGSQLNKPETFISLLKDLVDVLHRDFHGGPNKPRRRL